MPYFGIPIRNGLPIGLGSVAGFGVAPAFSPSVLFAAGEQGAWYDPSDLTTLFQDAAGTTPTTMETRVRLMLDKSGRGNHATAPSDASSPILRARYSLLTYSEDFSNAAWVKSTLSVSSNTTTAPDGTNTADTITATAGSGVHNIYNEPGQSTANVRYTLSVYVKPGTHDFVTLTLATGNPGSYVTNTVQLSTQTVTKTGQSSGTFVSSSVVDVGGGWRRLTLTGSVNQGAPSQQYFIIQPASGSNPTYGNFGQETWSAAGTETLFIWGADLRTSSDAALNIPAYQSITTATSYDTNGFPPYLAFDGTDDSLSTASIDFTGTDKMTVFAGVTKLSDIVAVYGELSANLNSNVGSFLLLSGTNNVTGFEFTSRGTNPASLGTTGRFAIDAPVTAVVTSIGDIAAPLASVRVNGVVGTNGTSSQGTGNYGNYPLFIGRRNNSSFPFNGRIYSLIIRGAATTTPLIASTEQWVAGKMRLPI